MNYVNYENTNLCCILYMGTDIGSHSIKTKTRVFIVNLQYEVERREEKGRFKSNFYLGDGLFLAYMQTYKRSEANMPKCYLCSFRIVSQKCLLYHWLHFPLSSKISQIEER